MDNGWSINPEDWKSLDQVIRNYKTWTSVLLTPNDQSVVPAGPGVYAICAPPPNAGGQGGGTMFHSLASPLYIGSSESSIKARFLTHCRTPSSQLRRAKNCYHRVPLSFWFIELPVSVVREAEAQLIRCFGPPVNRRAGTIPGTIKSPIEV